MVKFQWRFDGESSIEEWYACHLKVPIIITQSCNVGDICTDSDAPLNERKEKTVNKWDCFHHHTNLTETFPH